MTIVAAAPRTVTGSRRNRDIARSIRMKRAMPPVVCSPSDEFWRPTSSTSAAGSLVAMAYRHVFTGAAVADLGSALAWYEQLAGRPPDLVPNENEAVWHLTETASIYVVGDEDRAGRGLLTVFVADLERHVAELEARGLTTATIETVPGLFRKAVITDPVGNVITFAEDLSA